MPIQWLVVSKNPRTHNILDQRGTVIHAVDAELDETFEQIKHRRSLCGIHPKYGWTGDLWMEDRCRRCDHIINVKG